MVKQRKEAVEAVVYGGTYLKTRIGRARPRPLSTTHTMHLVVRSSKARGDWSFTRKGNRQAIEAILRKFARKHGVSLLKLGIVGNHLHIHLKLWKRAAYRPFIRATTAAIAMAITGASRWRPLKKAAKDRFWDYRPFTRVVLGSKAFKRLQEYIALNQLEGFGYTRKEARVILAELNSS